jgi:hypothetical protein
MENGEAFAHRALWWRWWLTDDMENGERRKEKGEWGMENGAVELWRLCVWPKSVLSRKGEWRMGHFQLIILLSPFSLLLSPFSIVYNPVEKLHFQFF